MGIPLHFHNTANALFSGEKRGERVAELLRQNDWTATWISFHIAIGVRREQGSGGVEELEKLFGGRLAGSVQVKMNNLGNTKKSMWHL